MGDAAGEPSHGFHPLRLPQLRLEATAIRDIANDQRARAGAVPVGARLRDFDREPLAVRAEAPLDGRSGSSSAGPLSLDGISGRKTVAARPSASSAAQPNMRSAAGLKSVMAPAPSTREDRVLGRGDDGAEPRLRFREAALHVHLLENAPDRLGDVVQILARLRDEVADAGSQRADCRAGVAEAGHEDDRDVPALFAEVAVEAQAVELSGQAMVEQDEGDRFGGESGARRRGILGGDDAIARAFQTSALQRHDAGVVFDDQDRFNSAGHRNSTTAPSGGARPPAHLTRAENRTLDLGERREAYHSHSSALSQSKPVSSEVLTLSLMVELHTKLRPAQRCTVRFSPAQRYLGHRARGSCRWPLDTCLR